MDIIFLGDVHWGHRRNPPTHMKRAFEHWMTDHETSLSKAVGWIFPGDLFDRLLYTFQWDLVFVLDWFGSIMDYAIGHDQFVRILDGTEWHDRRQARILSSIARSYPSVDYRYVETLEIEHLQRYDLDILYIPDNWSPDTETTRLQVVDLLKEKRLHAVDLSVVHGQFPHQLEGIPIPAKNLHDYNYYTRITKGIVVTSHIHTWEPKGIVIQTNSFERLHHGDEGEKGGLLADPKTGRYKRLINHHSMKFISITLDDDPDVSLKALNRACKEISGIGHIRLVGRADNPSMGLIKSLSKLYPSLRFTKKYPKIKKEEPSSTNTTLMTLSINKGNIEKLLQDFIRTDSDLSSSSKDIIRLLSSYTKTTFNVNKTKD